MSAALGLRNVAADDPMHENTLFWAASGLSKPLTAAAAMMLVDEGSLQLDAPLSEYLPELVGQPLGSATPRQALSHTAGLPFASAAELACGGGARRFIGSKFASYRDSGDDCVYDEIGLSDAIRGYAREPLMSEPGERFLYSNAGINLVGRIIEVISGIDFADFVDARLLRPLGMRDTTLWPSAEQLRRLATSYANDGGRGPLGPVAFPQLTAPYSDRRRAASPAGGYFSTAADCARFGRMMLRGGELDGRRYLSADAVAQMTACATGAASYGLGWSVVADDDGGFGHGGAMGSKLYVHPRAGRVAVLMVHQDGGFTPDDGQDWWVPLRTGLLWGDDTGD